ncbi:type 4a pilus biogenesis protein PilO [Inmirania thermothiophila]|uniref:Type IV pilus assembly protein PilO n=1 Tax=Inmirania thermothiophila TaxID=1750597 RepID=A0A3N1Y5P7_9GAMM|nr:type 4a pilus biogenesis protein PilO [Inmirania thermothiophila]ROR34123.1 type IV pilus assembly protein PilO [Inmirania thermothiophila]
MRMADLSQLRNLDLRDVGSWPAAARAVVLLAWVAAVLFLGYWFDHRNQLEGLARERAREAELKQTFEAKQHKAANLDRYKEQLALMRRSFGAMLRQLPDRTEVADLLVDVTQTGISSGLEFELFRPEQEQPKEFYAELPIRLRVVGRYHELGRFVSGLAALPRIVTIHEIRIAPVSANSEELVMEATAKTYRYLEEGEQR